MDSRRLFIYLEYVVSIHEYHYLMYFINSNNYFFTLLQVERYEGSSSAAVRLHHLLRTDERAPTIQMRLIIGVGIAILLVIIIVPIVKAVK